MKTVSVTEFRSNIKKYLDIAQTEKLVIHRSKNQSFVLVPLEDVSEEISLLSKAQKNAIDEALQQVKDGNIFSNEQAMNKIKSKFPKYFK
jgi:PHD/YefM family antitoxin component YafN of YafNO toxin-antitoxin module